MTFRLITFLSISILISACGGGGSTPASTAAETTTLLERNINSFIDKSKTQYSPAGVVLKSVEYSINKIGNVITSTYSGGNDYYYYNGCWITAGQ